METANERELQDQCSTKFLTILEAAKFLRVSRRTIFNLIKKGKIQTIKLSTRMTRITLDELLKLAETCGYQVIMPNGQKCPTSKPETGQTNKGAKCRKTRACDIAPEGVTHDTHYMMAEVLSKFNIKYGRFYDVRNRYNLKEVHA